MIIVIQDAVFCKKRKYVRPWKYHLALPMNKENTASNVRQPVTDGEKTKRGLFVFGFRFALPVNQQGNSGAHQQNGAGHADGSPVPVNDGFEYFADQQEA